MAQTIIPTKGNLLANKKLLVLAKLGYDLMDRKRNVLIREMMVLVETAKSMRDEIGIVYEQAYSSLRQANITLGLCETHSLTTPIDNTVEITYRSVMGVDIPNVTTVKDIDMSEYGYISVNSQYDMAFINFNKAKHITAVLAELENSIYRLADAIKKTSRRANALKNINIPRFETSVKFITNALEEKEREEFTRLKVISRVKVKQKAEQEQLQASDNNAN